MNIIRPGEDFDRFYAARSIFLAGPTPRNELGVDWRPDAIRLFKQWGFDGVLFVPSPFITLYDKHEHNYYHQIDWENRALSVATVIMFWVPRSLETRPAFTTNVEFGMYVGSGKIVYGRPDNAPKCGYLDWHAKQNSVPIELTLEGTALAAIQAVDIRVKQV